MSIITLDQLKKKTRWQEIVAERGVHKFNSGEYPFCIYKLLPSNPDWPSIDLHFDGDCEVLDPLGFSSWHGHYTRWGDSRRNLIEALGTVRELVSGAIGLVAEMGAKGDYRGGSLLPPDAVPGTLSKDVRQFRRVFFNRPPAVEEIDFKRYWEGKVLFVEWSTKAETEKIWREHGMPIEW